jgi:hypothetical protein
MSTDAEMNREISGTIAFALYPDRLRKDRYVKRLAERLENLDLLTALLIAGRLGELLRCHAIDGLTKLRPGPKKNGKR